MKIPLTVLSGVVAAVMAAPSYTQTTIATPSSTPCGDAGAAPCTNSPSSEAPDLTPTQWLFGHDVYQKLTKVSQEVMLGRHLHGPNLQLASSDAGGSINHQEARSAKHAPVGHDTGGSIIAAAERAPTDPAADASSQRYLVEEWRTAELAVADSVYHTNLDHIFQLFEIIERGHVAEPQLQQVLLRLDRMNQANQYAWFKFRREVNHEADSLVAAGGTR